MNVTCEVCQAPTANPREFYGVTLCPKCYLDHVCRVACSPHDQPAHPWRPETDSMPYIVEPNTCAPWDNKLDDLIGKIRKA